MKTSTAINIAIATTTIGAFVAGYTSGIVTTPPVDETVPHVMPFMTTPCEAEDSADCYWDAQEAGNGDGHSLYSLEIAGNLCTVFWDTEYGKQFNECVPEKSGWQNVTSELSDALAESGEPNANRDWTKCAVRYANTTTIVCPDGQVVTS